MFSLSFFSSAPAPTQQNHSKKNLLLIMAVFGGIILAVGACVLTLVCICRKSSPSSASELDSESVEMKTKRSYTTLQPSNTSHSDHHYSQFHDNDDDSISVHDNLLPRPTYNPTVDTASSFSSRGEITL